MNRNESKRKELKDALLREHSRKNSMSVVRMIEKDSSLLPILVEYLCGDEKLLVQRSATTANHYFERHPDKFHDYFKAFMDAAKKHLHPSVLRNFLRLLDIGEIPEEYEGMVLEMAYKNLLSERQPAAIRVFSLRAIVKLCEKHPSLTPELLDALQLIEAPTTALSTHIRMTRKRLLT